MHGLKRCLHIVLVSSWSGASKTTYIIHTHKLTHFSVEGTYEDQSLLHNAYPWLGCTHVDVDISTISIHVFPFSRTEQLQKDCEAACPDCKTYVHALAVNTARQLLPPPPTPRGFIVAKICTPVKSRVQSLSGILYCVHCLRIQTKQKENLRIYPTFLVGFLFDCSIRIC